MIELGEGIWVKLTRSTATGFHEERPRWIEAIVTSMTGIGFHYTQFDPTPGEDWSGWLALSERGERWVRSRDELDLAAEIKKALGRFAGSLNTEETREEMVEILVDLWRERS